MNATSRRGRVKSVDVPPRCLGLCGFILLLLAGPAWGQQPPAKQPPPVIVGESYDPKTVAAAEARIKDDSALVDAAKRGKVQQLNVGEFEIFHPKMENGKPVINSPVTWLAINSKLARKIEIPAGVEFAFVGKRKGDAEERLHEFKAEPFTWWMLLGRQQGFTPLVLVENGADPKKQPPRVADQMDLTVGPHIPEPGPEPGPGPGPAPIPTAGLRVLIVVESADLSRLPPAQSAMLRAREVQDYLNSHCVKVDNLPEWRVFDQHTLMDAAPVIWQEAMKRPRASLPWIVISDGTKGFEGSLPANKDALLQLLKQYGGP